MLGEYRYCPDINTGGNVKDFDWNKSRQTSVAWQFKSGSTENLQTSYWIKLNLNLQIISWNR